MTDDGLQSSEQRRRRCWFRRHIRLVLALAGVFGILAAAVWYYRAHIHWLYSSRQLELSGIRAIPDYPMPETTVPNGWVGCRVADMEFSLPPELAEDMIPPRNGATASAFRHGARAVAVAPPEDTSAMSAFLESASAWSTPSERFTTMPSLRRACYRVNADDFRWSMTPKEVAWHGFLVAMNRSMRLSIMRYTESFTGKDLDVIVIWFKSGGGVIEWQCRNRMYGGQVLFTDDSETADPGWIRAVCQSIKVIAPGDAVERQR